MDNNNNNKRTSHARRGASLLLFCQFVVAVTEKSGLPMRQAKVKRKAYRRFRLHELSVIVCHHRVIELLAVFHAILNETEPNIGIRLIGGTVFRVKCTLQMSKLNVQSCHIQQYS